MPVVAAISLISSKGGWSKYAHSVFSPQSKSTSKRLDSKLSMDTGVAPSKETPKDIASSNTRGVLIAGVQHVELLQLLVDLELVTRQIAGS